VASGSAACGLGGTQGNSGAATAEPTVKLTYLHQWSQTQGHGPITDTLAARFREQNPTIQVEPVYTANYYDKLAAVLAGGDFPDVVTYNLAWVPLLVKKNVLVSPETLAKGQYRFEKSDLVAGARDQATFEGKLMVTPYVVNNSGLAYNVSLYKQKGLDPAKPPTTWDELVDQAKRLTGPNGDKQIWGTIFPKGTADSISPLVAGIWSNGGDLVDVAKLTPVWNSAAAVEALQLQVDLIYKQRVAGYPDGGNAEQGDVGIWHIPPGNVSALNIRVKDAFEWGTAAFPKVRQQATTVGGHSLGVLKTGKYEAQAWRFVHFWIQPAQNAEYLVASGTLPPWKASEQHATWQKWLRDEPRVKPFVSMLAYGRPTPKLIQWQQITDLLVAARDAAAAQKQTPKEALDDAAREALPLIQQG
jgi:ABC-type glycerol-3-phosphate transport system substrate-binding protein